MSCHVANSLNFIHFFIAKIFHLLNHNQFIYYPFFADISSLTLIGKEEVQSYFNNKFFKGLIE